MKTDVEELTPLIEDLDSSRVNNLDEETLVRNRDLLLKRVADNRSTFSIRIRIDIEQVRRQNLQVTNEDIDNWTDSDSNTYLPKYFKAINYLRIQKYVLL